MSPHRPHCRYHHNNIIITHHKRSLTSPVACDSLSAWWQVGRKMAAVAECRLWLSRMFSSGWAKFQVKLRCPESAAPLLPLPVAAAAEESLVSISSGHRNDPTSISCLWSRIPAASLALALRAAVLKFLQFLRILLPTKSRPPFSHRQ